MPARKDPGPLKDIVAGLKRLKAKETQGGVGVLIHEAALEIRRLRKAGYSRSEIAVALREHGAPYGQRYLVNAISRYLPHEDGARGRSETAASPLTRRQPRQIRSESAPTLPLERPRRSGRLQGSVDIEEYDGR